VYAATRGRGAMKTGAGAGLAGNNGDVGKEEY